MSTAKPDTATPMIVASLQRAHDPIAREVAITGLFEDIANALAHVARALGVPLLATLGPSRDTTHTRKLYQMRFPPTAKQLRALTGPEERFEEVFVYARTRAEPTECARRRATGAGA
jgi:hypothetical protein